MRPTKFKECNTTFAKDQPEYLPLPVHRSADGIVTSCWKVNLWESVICFITGKIYISVMTFNNPLQPQKPSVTNPTGGSDD